MPDQPDENQPPFPPAPPVAPPAAPPAAPPPPPHAPAPSDLPPSSDAYGAAPPVGAPASVAYGQGKVSASDDRTFCVLSHALAIVSGFLAPLLFWLLKKDESPAVDAHAKESLNFQLNMVGWFVGSFILMLASCGVLFFLPWLIMIYAVVLSAIAAYNASEGKFFRYPLTWRLIK